MEAVRGHFCLLIIRANSRTTPKCLISSFINLHLSSKIYKNFNKWDSLKIINLHRMAGMNKTMLTVSNDKNLKLNFTKNGDLIYKGRFFSKVKFIYSEKATKFCEICPLLLTVCTVVKSKKISQSFVAFSEYMNFKADLHRTESLFQAFCFRGCS